MIQKENDLAEAVMKATDGKGANVVFDTVGSPVFAQCLPTLATGGRLIEISSPPGKSEVCFDLLDFYRKDLKLIGVNLADGHISMNPLKIRTIAILKSRNINSWMKMRSPKYKF